MLTDPRLQPEPLSPSQIAFQALQRWLDSRFHCMMGPPAAYFELPSNPDENGVHGFTRYTYQTLHWGIQADLADSAFGTVALLCDTFSQCFEGALAAFDKDSKPMLFWRITPQLKADPDTKQVTLRCRVVVPGYSFPSARSEGEGPMMIEVPRIARVQ